MALETSNKPFAKRIGLIFLSLWVALLIGSALYGSWKDPQAQGQISLYQTNLTLEALEWQGKQPDIKDNLFGEHPIQDAIEQYEAVKSSILKTNPTLFADHANAKTDGVKPLPPKDLQTRETLDQLNLQLGILNAIAGHTADATQQWEAITSAPYTSNLHRQNIQVADTLKTLWPSQGSHTPEAEGILQDRLSGWFKTEALEALFTQNKESAKLASLAPIKQAQAESAIARLFIAVGIPLIGALIGIGLLIAWGIKTIQQARGNSYDIEPQNSTVLTPPFQDTAPTPLGFLVPWDVETIWLTMLLWFFAFFGVSLIIPLSLQLVFGSAITASARSQSLLAFTNYSGLIVAGLSLLVFMTRPYLKNFFQWLPIQLQGKWVRWGLGGYIAALPIVLLVSLINQKLLSDQGGGNPLLDIILQTHDIGTWFILLVMVSVLAPIFEEIVFRGFVLTSLTRYLPLWGAIAVSASLFAIAHLNIADFLPLVVLGCILGTVYAQSRNLLASILLHSLWNGAQLVELLYLSGN